MNFNEAIDGMLAQARSIQKNINEAATKATEQMHPLIEESIHNATELQSTLSKHASELGELSAAQTQAAIGHLTEFSKLGQEAVQKTADQARQTIEQMAEQSKHLVDTMAAAWQQSRERDGHDHEGHDRP
jgi:DNA-directed RNA polymerase subunit F